ncbi:MAG: alpha/beta hydrolase [Acidimicrobiales bacterium]|nr:alpha/beta hydrolase [Acidimicrobiales bacterium]
MSKSSLRRAALALVALSLVAGLAACRTMPASGRYSTALYTDSQLTTVSGVTYATAETYVGSMVDLALDLYLPPADDGPELRPMVIAIHGGGFTSGSRSNMAGTARSYARRGFVAATISYRLDPGASPTNLARYLNAILDGIDDGMESVRWARSVASTYDIDTTRIAMVGSSAGGVIAMGTAVMDDPTPGGPLAGYSPKIGSAVSTGVNLTLGFDYGIISITPDDAPIHMFHYSTDTVTGDTFDTAFETCVHVSQGGAECSLVHNEGIGHTVSLSAEADHWPSQIGPHLWDDLDLYSLVPSDQP